MSQNVGYATLTVIPVSKGFSSALSGQINPGMGKAGTAGGQAYGGSMLASVKKFAAPMAGAFAAVKVVGLFKDAIAGASALSESTSKVGVVFGEAGAQILKASKTSATAMGLSSAAYLENTSTLGNLLVSLKIAPKEAATMSQSMVALASDMASLNNTSIDEAFNALRSGLTGETEPLKRFGVNMNEATLKAMALKMGLIETTKGALDPQTKALAAQALILDQTGTSQGDFARTSAGLANQQRIAAAQTEDLKTKLGNGLLPIVTKTTVAFNNFVGGMMDGTGAGGKLKNAVVAIYDTIKPFFAFLIKHKDVFVFIAGGVLIFKGLTTAIKLATAASTLYRGAMTSLMITQVAAIGPMTAMGVGATTTAVATSRLSASMVALRVAIFNIPIIGWIALGITLLATLYMKFQGVRDVVAVVANAIIGYYEKLANGGITLVNLLIKAWNMLPWVKDVKLLGDVVFPRMATSGVKALTAIGNAMDAAKKKGQGSGKTGSGKTGFGLTGGGVVIPGSGAGTGTGGTSSKLLDALNLKLAVVEQKKTLRDFSRYLNTDFISSIKDSGTKAADIIGKLVGGVDSLAKGFAATITDSKKQGVFNLASAKIVNALESKLLGFQTEFDAIQTARELLKTNIADADSALKGAIKLRGEAAGAISELLSQPFGEPSGLVKALSGAEATGDSIISGYNSMVKMVQDRFASIKGDKKDSLLSFLKDSTTQLYRLAKNREEIAGWLKLAQSALEDAIKTKTAYADNLSNGLKSAGLSLKEFIDKETGAASASGIIEGFKARLGVIKNFSGNLKSLASRGLNQNLLDEIIGMGTVDGGALAASLAAAGSDQIDTLNATGVAISALADSLGSALSDKFYGQSVANAQSIVKGFQDEQGAINAQMTLLSDGIAAQLAPLTNSMTSLGEDSALALLNGFKSQDNALIAQATSLGARMAQAIADALSALRVASGGGDFGVAGAKSVAAALAEEAARKLASDAAAKKIVDDAKALAFLKNNAGNGADARFDQATSKDIKDLAAVIAALPKSYMLGQRQGMRAE